jgi:hypothetical protein
MPMTIRKLSLHFIRTLTQHVHVFTLKYPGESGGCTDPNCTCCQVEPFLNFLKENVPPSSHPSDAMAGIQVTRVS